MNLTYKVKWSPLMDFEGESRPTAPAQEKPMTFEFESDRDLQRRIRYVSGAMTSSTGHELEREADRFGLRRRLIP